MSDSVNRLSPQSHTSWQSMGQGAQRETLTSLASPINSGELVLAADTGDSNSRTLKAVFRASEEGMADLSRLLISLSAVELKAGFDDSRCPYLNIGYPGDWIHRAVVQSIRVLNSRRLVVGQDYPLVPAAVFAATRRQNAINLGKVALESNDTIEISLGVPGYALKPENKGERKKGVRYLEHTAISMAVPFVPTVARDGRQVPVPESSIHCMEAAGPLEVDIKTARQRISHLRFAFEEDGVVDLDSLQLSAVLGKSQAQTLDVLDQMVVQDFRLPDGQSLIVGNEEMSRAFWNPAIPATVFTALGRNREWFRFGRLAVKRGQQISVTLRPAYWEGIRNFARIKNLSETGTATISGAFRFFTALGGHSANVSASSFFDRQPEGREAWHALGKG